MSHLIVSPAKGAQASTSMTDIHRQHIGSPRTSSASGTTMASILRPLSETIFPMPSRRGYGPRAVNARYYKIYARNDLFQLSRSQIETDSPSYLSQSLLEEFGDSRAELCLDTHPALFRIIVNHLSGYEVLPLTEKCCPPEMTVEQATRNLHREAIYLGLERLASLLTGVPNTPCVWDVTSKMEREGLDLLESHDDQRTGTKKYFVVFGIGIKFTDIRHRECVSVMFNQYHISELERHLSGYPVLFDRTITVQRLNREFSIVDGNKVSSSTLGAIFGWLKAPGVDIQSLPGSIVSCIHKNSYPEPDCFQVVAKKACFAFVRIVEGNREVWVLDEVMSFQGQSSADGLQQIMMEQ